MGISFSNKSERQIFQEGREQKFSGAHYTIRRSKKTRWDLIQQQITTSNLQICKKQGWGLNQQQIRTSNLQKTGGQITQISQGGRTKRGMEGYILFKPVNCPTNCPTTTPGQIPTRAKMGFPYSIVIPNLLCLRFEPRKL